MDKHDSGCQNTISENGVDSERMKALKRKYEKPEISELTFTGIGNEKCSDMASSCTAGGGDVKLTCGCGKFDVQP